MSRLTPERLAEIREAVASVKDHPRPLSLKPFLFGDVVEVATLLLAEIDALRRERDALRDEVRAAADALEAVLRPPGPACGLISFGTTCEQPEGHDGACDGA